MFMIRPVLQKNYYLCAFDKRVISPSRGMFLCLAAMLITWQERRRVRSCVFLSYLFSQSLFWLQLFFTSALHSDNSTYMALNALRQVRFIYEMRLLSVLWLLMWILLTFKLCHCTHCKPQGLIQALITIRCFYEANHYFVGKWEASR